MFPSSFSLTHAFCVFFREDQEFKGSEAWLLAKTCILDQMLRLFYDLLGTCTPWNSFHWPVGCLAAWQQPASPADRAGLGRTKRRTAPSRCRTTTPGHHLNAAWTTQGPLLVSGCFTVAAFTFSSGSFSRIVRQLAAVAEARNS